MKKKADTLIPLSRIKLMQGFTILVCLFLVQNIYSQDRTEKVTELVTWTLLQTVPSPAYFQDHDKESSGLRFGLAWNISPVNFFISVIFQINSERKLI